MPQGGPAAPKYLCWERAHLLLNAHVPQASSMGTLRKHRLPPQALGFCEDQIFDGLNSHPQEEVLFVRRDGEERGCIFPGHHGPELRTVAFLQ